MKLPDPAGGRPEIIREDAFIKNPYPGKEMLTKEEALNCISLLSAMMLADVNYRRHKKSDRENHGDI